MRVRSSGDERLIVVVRDLSLPQPGTRNKSVSPNAAIGQPEMIESVSAAKPMTPLLTRYDGRGRERTSAHGLAGLRVAS